jgi:hypothetical protein
MKICTKCNIEKDLDCFHGRSDRPSKKNPICKQCRKKLYDNTDAKRLKARNYQQTAKPKFGKYKYYAEKRNIKWSLSFDEFMSFWQKPCYYCGDSINTVGLDRIDNKLGYIINNVVSCCEFCNIAKNNNDVKTFIDKCIKIAEKHHVTV